MEGEKKELKILLCDDDRAFRKLVQSYLRSEREFVLIEAGRKGEIQAALDQGGIDLVLMDILMPEKSGMEWLEEIVEKQIAPVVMLTGFGSEEIAVQSIHEGAIDYIPKDRFTRDRLLSTIRVTLETWKRKLAEEERKRAEEALAESEKRYRVLFENAKDGIFIEDLTGQIIEVNQKACEMLGYTHDELSNLNVEDIVPPEVTAWQSEFVQQIKKAGHTFIQVENVRKDGTRISVEMSGTIVEISGKPHVIAIVRDITERKRVEEELQKSMAELERFNRLAVGRELRMIELKREVDRFCERLGEKPPYDLSTVDAEKGG